MALEGCDCADIREDIDEEDEEEVVEVGDEEEVEDG
jgi:hypothetical protein